MSSVSKVAHLGCVSIYPRALWIIKHAKIIRNNATVLKFIIFINKNVQCMINFAINSNFQAHLHPSL